MFFTGSTEVHEEGRYSVEATFTIGDASSSRRFSPVPVLKRVRPCDVRGGSDLPDTVATVRGVLSRDGSRLGETSPHRITLGPDQARPDVTINSSPPPGSKVERGDTIRFARGDVLAREIRRGATWQTGVQSLQLVAPDGLVTDAQADSNRSLPCDEKQWSLGTPQAQYEVPGDAKGEIKICAMAVDFAGNENNDTCASYYVGEVWEGTFRQRAEVVGTGNPCSWTYEGPVQVVVARDGSLTGSVSASFTEVMEDPALPCVGVPPGGGQATHPISGDRDRNRFKVNVSGPTGSVPLELNVAGKKAEGSTQVGGYIDTTMNLTCKTCEDEAVG